MEGMTRHLDAHGFTASRRAGWALPPASVPGYSRLARGQATAVNFFPNGAQKYQMWGFMPEAPPAGLHPVGETTKLRTGAQVSLVKPVKSAAQPQARSMQSLELGRR